MTDKHLFSGLRALNPALYKRIFEPIAFLVNSELKYFKSWWIQQRIDFNAVLELAFDIETGKRTFKTPVSSDERILQVVRGKEVIQEPTEVHFEVMASKGRLESNSLELSEPFVIIRFVVLQIGAQRLNVRGECLYPGAFYYFWELLSSIASHFPETKRDIEQAMTDRRNLLTQGQYSSEYDAFLNWVLEREQPIQSTKIVEQVYNGSPRQLLDYIRKQYTNSPGAGGLQPSLYGPHNEPSSPDGLSTPIVRSGHRLLAKEERGENGVPESATNARVIIEPNVRLLAG